jgi:c-di-GMP-binding flagellar brake protein YcgR
MMEKKIKDIIHMLSQDKRKCERVELAVMVYYRFPGGLDWQGPFVSVNIGGNGISFILGEEIAKHAELELKIVLPQDPQRPIEVRGEVIWTSHMDERYRLGIRFAKMKEDDRRRFVSYICDTILATYLKDK